MKKNILFIAPQPFFELRGSPIRVMYDVKTLGELGFSVDLVTMPAGEDRDIPGVRIHRAAKWLGIRSIPIGISFRKFLLDFFILFRAVWFSMRKRYAVIVGVEDAGIIAWVASIINGAECVFEKHSDYASYIKSGLRLKNLALWFYSRVERFVIRHADAVIATGPGLAEQARAVCPLQKVYTIFDPPSSEAECVQERIPAAREKIRAGGEDCVVLYVGSFAVYQGIDLLFESMARVLKKIRQVKFVVIGGSRSEIMERKKWLGDRGVDDQVLFLGKIDPDELPQILHLSDILLSPRISGGNTPLKLLDYLKAGKAIVATDIQANRWILDEQTAVLVRPEADAFAAGVIRAVENKELRRKLGSAARGLFEKKYSLPEFRRRMKECYDDSFQNWMPVVP